jgi:hypothetical protein
VGSRVGNPVVVAGKKKTGRRREEAGVFVSASEDARKMGRKEHPPFLKNDQFTYVDHVIGKGERKRISEKGWHVYESRDSHVFILFSCGLTSILVTFLLLDLVFIFLITICA